jgi:hypothetical protein
MSDNEDFSDSESEQSEQETYKVKFPKTQKTQIINDDDDDDDDDDSKIDDAEISDDDNESDEGVPNEVKFKFQEDEEHQQIESDDDANIEEDEDEYDDEVEVGALDEEEFKNMDVQTESKKPLSSKKTKKQLIIIDDDDDDEDEFNENYLEKFDADLVKNYIDDFHPECFSHNYDEISKLSVVIRNSDGIVIDPLHRTIPYLTKYEKTRVLGQRAKQIETGAKPFVKVPEKDIERFV